MDKLKACIFDVDGTVSDSSPRLHYVQPGRYGGKDWDSFFKEAESDKPFKYCVEMIKAMNAKGYFTFFVTGRSERQREETKRWLDKYVGLDETDYRIYMRPLNDKRHDYEIKREIYFKLIDPEYEVLFVLEDRRSVVNMYRSIGLQCLQVNDWDDKNESFAKEVTGFFKEK